MGWEEQPEPKKPTIPRGFEPMPKMKKIPLIGAIACGEPITAEQNIEKWWTCRRTSGAIFP